MLETRITAKAKRARKSALFFAKRAHDAATAGNRRELARLLGVVECKSRSASILAGLADGSYLKAA